MKVYFTTLGDPDKKYYASLRSVEPAPTDFTGETTTGNTSSAIYYYGLFDVDNPDGTLRPSMTAQVYIVLEGANNVLTIPAAALGRKGKDGSYTVRVVGKDKTKPRLVKVKTGINDGTNVQILSGLKAGQQVVIAQASASGSSASSGGNRSGNRSAGGLGGGGARPPRGL
jgi:macrolide-specific efflux system membrane fusion protein